MNILVTGGSGLVGRGVVQYLVERGHAVRSLDRAARDPLPGVETVECDVTDFAAVREQVRGMDAIIHLAAYAHPAAAAGQEIFRVNCCGTYNVYEAAAQEGIRRVAQASSINALGYNFGVKSFSIQYFPIDEAHPAFTTDPYSFSKQVVEEIAAYYWRREGITGVSLRMPGIYAPTPEMAAMAKQYAAVMQSAYQALIDAPEAERRERVERIMARLEAARAARRFEKPWEPEQAESFDPMDPDNLVSFGHTDFWAILSVQDAAQAFEKAVTAAYEGSHPLYVCEAENFTGMPSEDLLRVFFPQVTRRTRPILGAGNLVSYERARALIGFEPVHLIREMVE